MRQTYPDRAPNPGRGERSVDTYIRIALSRQPMSLSSYALTTYAACTVHLTGPRYVARHAHVPNYSPTSTNKKSRVLERLGSHRSPRPGPSPPSSSHNVFVWVHRRLWRTHLPHTAHLSASRARSRAIKETRVVQSCDCDGWAPDEARSPRCACDRVRFHDTSCIDRNGAKSKQATIPEYVDTLSLSLQESK